VRRDKTLPSPGGPGAAERLEAALRGLAEQYALLESIGAERLAALRCADLPGVARAMARENEAVQRIAALDRDRAAAAAEVGASVGLPRAQEPRAGTLAQRLAEPARSALLEASGALRAIVERVHAQSQRAIAASQTLASHMQGLIRTAERSLSHSGAYGRRGVVEPGPAVVSALDVVT